MKNEVMNFFDVYSTDFSSIYGSKKNVLKIIIDRWLRKSMWIRYNKTMQTCQPIQGKTVLDIGCGPGTYCLSLAKKGAYRVLGIDFAEQMIEIARTSAKQSALDNICSFDVIDFYHLDTSAIFDYIIVMGVMDYIKEPLSLVNKALQLGKRKIVFSFPATGGFLAWQRKLRYKFKCPLYLYTEKQIKDIFYDIKPWSYKIERIQRDFFVTLEKRENETI